MAYIERLVGVSPCGTIETWHKYDPVTDTTIIATRYNWQAVSHIIEANKAAQNDESVKRNGVKQDFMPLSRIPYALLDVWKREDGVDFFNHNHDDAIKRRLRDPEYRYLRTTLGNI